MKTVIDQNDVDVLVSGMSYSGNAGAAGVPALTIPAGLDPKGRPQGVILSGPYLSEPKLFAVGYALERASGLQQSSWATVVGVWAGAGAP